MSGQRSPCSSFCHLKTQPNVRLTSNHQIPLELHRSRVPNAGTVTGWEAVRFPGKTLSSVRKKPIQLGIPGWHPLIGCPALLPPCWARLLASMCTGRVGSHRKSLHNQTSGNPLALEDPTSRCPPRLRPPTAGNSHRAGSSRIIRCRSGPCATGGEGRSAGGAAVRMTKNECPMTKEIQNPNGEVRTCGRAVSQ